MSLILDALKKLDREKSTRRDRAANIAADILGPDLPRPGKRIRLYVATVFLTAVAATVITYAVIVQIGFLSKSSSPSPLRSQEAGGQVASALPSREPVRDDRRKMGRVSPSVQTSAETKKTAEVQSPPESRQTAPTAAPSSREPIRDDRRKMGHVSPGTQRPSEIKKPAESQSPAETQQVAPAPLSREPVRVDRDEPGRVVPKIEKPAESESPADSKKSLTSLGEKKASQDVVSEKGDITPRGAEKTVERVPNLSAAAPSSLKISGIVWHEEASRRLAVINGMVTNEGSIIEGVKILEIFPDRVRFSQEGLHFDIPFR
jgi:hypothetical protein